MHIEINDNTTLQDIQETFSAYYPYLQIEFYNKGHKKYEMSDKRNVVYPGKKISEIKKTHLSALLEIQPWYKVADVEKEFQQRFGLSVQVFWNENEAWHQTSGMDDFTLKELNEMGWDSSDESVITDYEQGS